MMPSQVGKNLPEIFNARTGKYQVLESMFVLI